MFYVGSVVTTSSRERFWKATGTLTSLEGESFFVHYENKNNLLHEQEK